MDKLILKKINILNQASLQSMTDENNISIIKNFTEESLKLLGADFGFAWGKFSNDKEYHLIYKSSKAPLNPTLPKITGKNSVGKKGYILFESKVNKENYEAGFPSSIKSYIIIPIRYWDHVYGSIVVCYNKPHDFTKEELALSETIGNTVAHLVTINWLIEKEQKALALAEKQTQTQMLLTQEKLKAEFLANATHEFRTPLAVIRGNVDLALSAKGAQKIKDTEIALKEINGEVAYLSQIMSDLAMLISGEARGEKGLNLKELDLISIINKTTKRLGVLLKKKNISFKITGDDSKVIVMGDEENLERLFMNLIRNAITYGKENGKITIEIKRDKKVVTVKIIDTGIGISKEDLPHIFERFFRSKKARETTTIGTGLGLAICKWIVESHRGSIAVESIEDKGSTFSITLPTRKN